MKQSRVDTIHDLLKDLKKVSAKDLIELSDSKPQQIHASIFAIRSKGYQINLTRENGKYHYEYIGPKPLSVGRAKSYEKKDSGVMLGGVHFHTDILERCRDLISAHGEVSTRVVEDCFGFTKEETECLIKQVAKKYKEISVSFTASIQRG